MAFALSPDCRHWKIFTGTKKGFLTKKYSVSSAHFGLHVSADSYFLSFSWFDLDLFRVSPAGIHRGDVLRFVPPAYFRPQKITSLRTWRCAMLSAFILFFFADRMPGRPVFLLLISAFLFLMLEVSLFLFPVMRKMNRRFLFILFMAILMAGLLFSFLVSSFLCCAQPAPQSTEDDFQLQIAVLSGLQPDKRAIRVLLLSPPGLPVESMSSFPLTNKLTHLPLSFFSDPFVLLEGCPFNYDLILLMPPEPETFASNRLYTPDFFLLLRNHLAPNGVLGVIVPEFSGAQYRKDRLFEIRGIVAATLRRLFPKVRLAPGGTHLLICGGDNVSNDLQELNERAGKLLGNSDFLPSNLLLLLNTPEEMEARNRSFAEYSVTAKQNLSFPPPLLTSFLRGTPEIDRTPLGALADFYRRAAGILGSGTDRSLACSEIFPFRRT